MSRWCVGFLVVLVAGLALAAKESGKYSKEKNRIKEETQLRQPSDDQPGSRAKTSGHFRVARLDAVWERAQRNLNIDDQRDIFEELQDLDEDEITLKRLRHDGGDKNGDITAKLQDRLHDILDRYSLLTPLHDKKDTSSSGKSQNAKLKDKKVSKPNSTTMDLLFTDKKLNKLWGKAQKAGFTNAELETLKVEFDHHQKKLDEYRAVESLRPSSKTDNRFHDMADNLSHEGVQEKTEDQVTLDQGIKDIVKSYGRLKAKVHKNAFEPSHDDARIEELWKNAMDAGFTRDELLSLREELSHFERKLDKLKNLNEGLGSVTGKNQRDSQLKYGQNSEEDLDLDLKTKHYASKVESIHNDLERRINNRHNEL